MQAEALLSRLLAIAGEDAVHAGLPENAVDAVVPAAVVSPQSVALAQEIVRFARAERLAIIPAGGGTKLFLGNPPERLHILLSSRRLNQVVDYDYDNLTVGAGAGITLAELQSLLGTRNQFLAVDGPRCDRATLGGTAAANATGPRRFRYGAPRDLVVGTHCILGYGDFIKAGGKVVKNVSGFDLNKLLVGSYGTLGFVTELTWRVHPRPEMEASIISSFGSLDEAAALAKRVLDSYLVPSAIEIFDSGTAHLIAGVPGPFATLVAFEGVTIAVEKQVHQVLEWAPGGQRLGAESPSILWSRLSDFAYAPTDGISWKAGVPLSASPALLAAAHEVAKDGALECQALAHYASGFVLGVFAQSDPARIADAVLRLRERAKAYGGYLVLLRAPPEWKRALNAWGEVRGDFEIVRRIKETFDPDRVFSPGRFAGNL